MNRNTIGPIGLGVLMGRRGQHLSVEERAVIFSEHLRDGSQRQIAVLFGRAPSTICRELARGREGGGTDPAYCPQVSVRSHCSGMRRVVWIVSALDSGHYGVLGGSAHEAALD